jgi:hypothetical protein
MRLGARGGPFTTIEGTQVIPVDSKVAAVTSTSSNAAQQDWFLTFEVKAMTLWRGDILWSSRYAPDYSENESSWNANLFPAGQFDAATTLRSVDGFIYAQIGRRLYRYRFATSQGQRPSLELCCARVDLS